jgi:hypothetical protein
MLKLWKIKPLEGSRMVVGFNHNFSYKGQVYHVQTEDSGIKNPHIITLLYRGGTILSSKKTSYADIIKVDNLEIVVEDLMKSQHREMLRLLKNGDFDELLDLPPTTAQAVAPAVPPSAPPVPPAITAPPPSPDRSKPPLPPPPAGLNLDEIILSYMVGEDKKK